MKFVFALLLVVLAITFISGQDAVQISGNNVGDIITVGIKADAVLSSNANLNMINAILGLINKQALVATAEIPAPNSPTIE